jgi:hypothetical protein
MFFRCDAKGVVILSATPLIQCLARGNRAQRARFPVPRADSASRSLRRGAPSFASSPLTGDRLREGIKDAESSITSAQQFFRIQMLSEARSVTE